MDLIINKWQYNNECKIFLVLILVINFFNLPVCAISQNTYILPYIGNGADNTKNYINKKIDLAPIKLPPKIKNFELLEAERALLPNILKDQVSIYSYPLRVKYSDLKYLVPIGGITAGLLISDNKLLRLVTDDDYLPHRTQKDISKVIGMVGGYVPIFLPAALSLTGGLAKNERLRETGILQYQALGNSIILYKILSNSFGRVKPSVYRKERGVFFDDGSSFPSGHSASAWALASVLANQYPDKKWVKLTSYSLATAFSVARVLEGVHYPSDVFLGAIIGYSIGKYVVKKHSKYKQNPEIALNNLEHKLPKQELINKEFANQEGKFCLLEERLAYLDINE
jgi:hypothetical protein